MNWNNLSSTFFGVLRPKTDHPLRDTQVLPSEFGYFAPPHFCVEGDLNDPSVLTRKIGVDRLEARALPVREGFFEGANG